MTINGAVSELDNLLKADDIPFYYKSSIQAVMDTIQPTTGHWIVEVWNNKEHYTCSVCQRVVNYEPCYHYCPYCGTEMAESQKKEKDDEVSR